MQEEPPVPSLSKKDDPQSTEPFFWRAGPIGCLLIHGLTSTPFEMRALGEQLHAAGCTVSGVRLAGHGTRLDDLEKCSRKDWYASAEQGLMQLADAHCSMTIAIGSSLGSLLCLRLAAAHRELISALVLLSTALQLRN